MIEINRLEAAIAALEAQRPVIGDAVADMALAPLRAKLASLRSTDATPAADQTLKQATVLFVDVVGSTAMESRLDPEDIHALVDGALEVLTGVVVAHRGQVLQYAGDSLLAVFGVPDASEDDPERAVRAGLAILEAARPLARAAREKHRVEAFDLRVGIHTGRVLLGGGIDAERSIRGSAVNIAARMEQSAPVGGLRISHGTYRHVRGVFDVVEESVQVKGADEPLRSYIVLRAKPRAFRIATRGVEGVETRMVGRDDEITALQRAFIELCGGAEHEGAKLNAIFVVGEAGIGKSRLLYEFENWAEARPEPFVIFQGRAQPQTMTRPYGLLRDLLGWRLEINDNDPGAVARDKFTQGVAPLFDHDGEAHAHLLGHLIGLDFSASPHVRGIVGDARQIRDRGFHAAAQFLRLTASRQRLPVVLMLDDLHWADEGSLDFIDQLLQLNRDVPVLVIALTRPSLFERRPDWANPRAVIRRIDLVPLTKDHSREFANVLLQRIDHPPALLRELITGGAEGNPFYMEELLKMLIDEGAIDTGSGSDNERWRVLPDRLLATHVPPTLTGVLQARLDTLSERDRQVLQQASVLGIVFWDQALAALADRESPPHTFAQALESLARRELIQRREPSAFVGASEYSFKHQILHQVIYDSILRRQRRDWHARAAAWLAQLPSDRAGEHLGAAADHYERAGDTANACHFFTLAAEWAMALCAHSQMLTYVERTLALCAADDRRTRWRVLALRERFLVNHGDRTAHAADLDALQALADALDDDALRADAIWRRAYVLENDGEFAAAAQAGRQSLALARKAGASDVATKAYAGLGYDLFRQGLFDEAQQVVDEGLALARATGFRGIEPHLLTDAGGIASARGDPAAAVAFFHQALAITRELNNRGNEAMMLNNLGDGAIRMGDYAAASLHLAASLDVSRATGNRTCESLALQNLATVAQLQGDNSAALASAQAALDIQMAMDQRQSEGISLDVIGHAELGLRRAEAAQSAFRRARELFVEIDMPVLAMEATAGLARVALAQGKTARAVEEIEPLLAYYERGGKFEGAERPLQILLTCWQVLCAAGDVRAASLLASAHAELQAQAGRIGDSQSRHNLLHNVPYHREILEAWQQRAG